MTCPFLREAQVKYCATSAVRKFIPLPPAAGANEKCTSVAHTGCQAYGSQPARQSAPGTCPYLRESLMQFWQAVSMNFAAMLLLPVPGAPDTSTLLPRK